VIATRHHVINRGGILDSLALEHLSSLIEAVRDQTRVVPERGQKGVTH
jgi:hypothetical protein